MLFCIENGSTEFYKILYSFGTLKFFSTKISSCGWADVQSEKEDDEESGVAGPSQPDTNTADTSRHSRVARRLSQLRVRFSDATSPRSPTSDEPVSSNCNRVFRSLLRRLRSQRLFRRNDLQQNDT